MKQFSMAILIAAVCAMSSAYAANSVVNKVVKVKVITAGSPTPITVQYSEKAFYTDGESDRNSNPLDLKSDNTVISTSSYSSESLKQFSVMSDTIADPAILVFSDGDNSESNQRE